MQEAKEEKLAKDDKLVMVHTKGNDDKEGNGNKEGNDDKKGNGDKEGGDNNDAEKKLTTPTKPAEAEGTAASQTGTPDKVERPLSASGSSMSKAASAQKALKVFIARFSLQQGEADKIGSGPPCRSYRSLVCLDDLVNRESEFHSAQTKTDIDNVKLKLKPFKLAITDLLSMSKAAAKRLDSLIVKARNPVADTKRKKSLKVSAEKAAPRQLACKKVKEDLFGFVASQGNSSLAVSNELMSWSAVNLLKVDLDKDIFQAGETLMKSVDSFLKKFAGSRDGRCANVAYAIMVCCVEPCCAFQHSMCFRSECAWNHVVQGRYAILRI